MKITKEQRKEVVELYRAGKSSIEIGEIYGVSKTAILCALKNMNEPRRPAWSLKCVKSRKNKLSTKEVKNVIVLYNNGKSQKELCEIYKVSRSLISLILKQNNVVTGQKRLKKKRVFTCKICKKENPINKMVKNKRTILGISKICKACRKEKDRKKNIQKYGITENDYRFLMKKQEGGCAICGTPVNKTSHGLCRLAIDHSHTTGKVRGLLCGNCNRGIGHLQDSPELLEKAAQYLRSYA